MSSNAVATTKSGNPPSRFNIVFSAVFALTVSSLVGGLLLAVAVKDPSDHVRKVMDICFLTWQTGFGAMVGLLGGRQL